eukprot:951444-Prorocentrum_minimum.AAC.2
MPFYHRRSPFFPKWFVSFCCLWAPPRVRVEPRSGQEGHEGFDNYLLFFCRCVNRNLRFSGALPERRNSREEAEIESEGISDRGTDFRWTSDGKMKNEKCAKCDPSKESCRISGVFSKVGNMANENFLLFDFTPFSPFFTLYRVLLPYVDRIFAVCASRLPYFPPCWPTKMDFSFAILIIVI